MDENKVNNGSLYDEDVFKNDIDDINKEIQDIDNLYQEVKQHFDMVKNSQARGSLVFVKDQTSNLISLKESKLHYIKQRMDAKSKLFDMQYKDTVKNNTADGGNANSLTLELLDRITRDFQYNKNQHDEDVEEAVINEVEDVDVDAELDERANEDAESIESIVAGSTSTENIEVPDSIEEPDTTEEDTAEIERLLSEDNNDEEDNTIIAMDNDSNMFYRLDKDTLDIVEELGFIEDIEDTTEIDGDSYAIGASGDMYLLISLSDDEDE